ncbi:MAG: nitroreductase family protein, partial [Thioalkalispiraceae bacterium]
MIDQQALHQLFLDARSHSYWQDKPVSEQQIRQIYELTRMGPTSANSCPARFVFITTEKAKQRLTACLDEGNVQKSMTAPAVAI